MAYAALLSLTHVLEQTLNRDYSYLNVDEKQQIASLLEKVSFLQDFLDNSSQKNIKTVQCLGSQIRDAAFKADDIIESHLTDRVRGESASQRRERLKPFFHKLERVIKEIDSIKKTMEKIEDMSDVVQDQQQQSSSIPPVGSPRIPSGGNSTVVGFDEDLLEIKTRLISGSSNLQTIALVGMGGIGKTTVAQKVYDDPFIVHHFDTCAWVTVSQDYNVKEILLGLVDCTKNLSNKMCEESNDKLVELLYKTLKGRRYFIVMDDIWDTEFWDNAILKPVFPNDKNGSRILLTTRYEKVAFSANSSLHNMHFLDKDDSWKLFCEKVFRQDCCPPELEPLEGIGKNIVQHCKGLPLAIVVIGGFLSKHTRTQHDWINIAENLSSVITSNDERYSKILSLSYKNLPHHLKGCFLYMGVYQEDFNIRVSTLVKLWIAEGFIKPVRFKRLEEVGEEYVSDLVERSLIMISQRSSMGKIKDCKIHDLLRRLSLSEAKMETFFHVLNRSLDCLPQGTSVRRLSIHHRTKNLSSAEILSTSLPRSILNFLGAVSVPYEPFNLGNFLYEDEDSIPSEVLNSRVLRVLHNAEMYPNTKLGPVNLRYLTTKSGWLSSSILKSIHKFRNLQTLHLQQSTFIVSSLTLSSLDLPPEIWKMRQLRHVQLEASVNLPDPPNAEIKRGNSIIVLENLQTLFLIKNFRCTVQVLKRIPNLRKLGIYYGNDPVVWGRYCLNNLVLLHKLEALKCFFYWKTPSFLKNITFPTFLKKLTIIHGHLPWEDMTIVGSLPDLQVLKLKSYAFIGPEWVPNEEEFLQLKFLLLENINVKYWRAESIHFPKLQPLSIKRCKDLEEIPSGIGEIATLQSIELCYCRASLATSAKQIQETQQSYGIDDLQVRIL